MIYRALRTNPKSKAADDSWRDDTFGGQFMTICQDNRWTPATHMPAIVDAFHHMLGDYWKWDAKGKKSYGDFPADMLDGKPSAAECQLAANAFLQVLKAPAPYGFGLIGDQAEVDRYYGPKERLLGFTPDGEMEGKPRNIYQPGFVSRHPKAGLFGLKPNVYDPTTGDLAPLYFWANHKTVKVQAQLWDVCYNTSYDLPSQMAVAMIVGVTESIPENDTAEALMSITWETKLFIKRHAQITYLRPAAEESSARAAGAEDIGPFTDSLFGDDSTVGMPPAPSTW